MVAYPVPTRFPAAPHAVRVALVGAALLGVYLSPALSPAARAQGEIACESSVQQSSAASGLSGLLADPCDPGLQFGNTGNFQPAPASERPDSDSDGLYDDDELYVYGTDPYWWDTDGDGAGDGEEVYVGTDPNW